MFGIKSFIEFDAQKTKSCADASANGLAVFADVTREYECVQSVEHHGKGANPLFRLVTKQ